MSIGYYRRWLDGKEIFICRDCWTGVDPMKAVVPMCHGKLT